MHVSPGPLLVGLVFLWTAGLKALSPDGFYTHLSQLGFIPRKFLVSAVVLAAAGEAAFGAALVTGIMPAIVLPATVILLAVLTAFTWFSISSGRVTDCGCYGGMIVPSMPQTLGINGLMIALILSGMLWGTLQPLSHIVGTLVVAILAIAFGAFAWYALWYMRTKGVLLVDLSPLKVGNKWKKSWAANSAADNTGEMIVAYLGPDCPFCKMWIPILNAIDRSDKMPRIVGIVGASRERLDTFRDAQGIKFSTDIISQSLMNRLVTGVPTTVVVTNGIISDIWKGQMSPDFAERFKRAFFPAAVSS
jgi:hypothetical protein